ncbi:SRPBCC family protein [Nocardia goodfellowii]|uniref:Membrane protein n=1 Tax=Nocardia goodfellowii TaxID=882446 RepID=A0ABS4QQK7_9NOCA|nr:SRPBCC family protein [Nocardia goodfellowii]MBP2193975.1 putative membrane protein [Nocardia goodfellowii]
MGHVEHAAVANAPREYAFEYVDDYRNVPRWMFGVKHFTPVGEQTSGVGAVFDTAINLGPMTLHVRGDVIEWEENSVIALRAVKGIEGRMRWHFETLGADTAKISVVCDYQVPGGLTGRALDRVIQAFIGPAIRHTEKHLRQQIESGYQKASSA